MDVCLVEITRLKSIDAMIDFQVAAVFGPCGLFEGIYRLLNSGGV